MMTGLGQRPCVAVTLFSRVLKSGNSGVSMSEKKITFCEDGPTVGEPKSASLYFEGRRFDVDVSPGSSAKQIAELMVERVNNDQSCQLQRYLECGVLMCANTNRGVRDISDADL